jgi:hypothetical protein
METVRTFESKLRTFESKLRTFEGKPGAADRRATKLT